MKYLVAPIFVAALLTSTLSQAAVDFVSKGDCPAPVRIERTGELASWQTKDMSVPFAVESADTNTWLYVPGGGPPNQGSVSQADFDGLKALFVKAVGSMEGVEAVDGGSMLTLAYEDPGGGGPEHRISAMRIILTGGCVISLILTKRGAGETSDVLELLDLVKVGD